MVQRFVSRIQWSLAVLLFFFGALTFDRGNPIWGAIFFLFYSLPFLSLLCRAAWLRASTFWLGILLCAQSILSAAMPVSDYHTLPPYLDESCDIHLPGIEGRQHITTDGNGYRVTRSLASEENARALRIYAIGGSTTEQLHLDDRRTWTHLLQEQLEHDFRRPVQVVNTGLSGLRSPNHLATLKKILPLHPRTVLFMLGVNDWLWDIRSHFDPVRVPPPAETFRDKAVGIRRAMLVRNTILGKILADPGPTIAFLKPAVLGIRNETRGTCDWKEKPSLEKPDKRTYHPAGVRPEYEESLAKIIDVCRAERLQCIFINQPNGYQPTASPKYRETFWMTPPHVDYTLDFDSMAHVAKLYNDYLRELTRREGQPFCDIASGLPASHEAFYDDVHFNENGARQVADLLHKCLKAIPLSSDGAGPG